MARSSSRPGREDLRCTRRRRRVSPTIATRATLVETKLEWQGDGKILDQNLTTQRIRPNILTDGVPCPPLDSLDRAYTRNSRDADRILIIR